jgi:hypothetical protein
MEEIENEENDRLLEVMRASEDVRAGRVFFGDLDELADQID